MPQASSQRLASGEKPLTKIFIFLKRNLSDNSNKTREKQDLIGDIYQMDHKQIGIYDFKAVQGGSCAQWF